MKKLSELTPIKELYHVCGDVRTLHRYDVK